MVFDDKYSLRREGKKTKEKEKKRTITISHSGFRGEGGEGEIGGWGVNGRLFLPIIVDLVTDTKKSYEELNDGHWSRVN